MTPSTPPDDWQVVEDALLVLRDGSLTASMASNAPPALVALARLREQSLREADRDLWKKRAEAAEARVKELAAALREIISEAYPKDAWFVDIARCALAHEEEDMTASPFPQPALESEEKGLFRDREIPARPADVAHEEEEA